MNECFFIGEVIKIERIKFIINGKRNYKSVINIILKLQDEQIVYCKGFDEVADFIIQKKSRYVFINGYIVNNYIHIKEICDTQAL